MEHDLLVVAVLGCDHQAGSSLQFLLINRFQAINPYIIRVEESQDMGRQGTVRIVALGIAEQVDALNVLPGNIIGNKRPDLISDLFIHTFFQDLILGPGLFHFIPNILLLYLQDSGQLGGNKVLILLSGDGKAFSVLHTFRQGLCPLLIQLIGPLLDHLGVQENRVCCCGNSQRLPIAVIDRPPGGRNGSTLRLLAGSAGLHLLVAIDGQIIRLGKQSQKGAYAENHQQIQRSALDGKLGAAGSVRLSLGLFCHKCLLICMPWSLPCAPSHQDIPNEQAGSKRASLLLPGLSIVPASFSSMVQCFAAAPGSRRTRPGRFFHH